MTEESIIDAINYLMSNSLQFLMNSLHDVKRFRIDSGVRTMHQILGTAEGVISQDI